MGSSSKSAFLRFGLKCLCQSRPEGQRLDRVEVAVGDSFQRLAGQAGDIVVVDLARSPSILPTGKASKERPRCNSFNWSGARLSRATGPVDTDLRKKGFTQYKAGYLPYTIIDGWQQIRKDFAYWRALMKAIETAATPEERAWFEADRKRREAITLHDIGIWSHYVGDASQPLHVSIHFNGWGDFPNPNGYTNSKKVHAYFEGEFVKKNLSRAVVAAAVGPYRICNCTIEEQMPALLLNSLSRVEPLYQLEKEGGFKPGDSSGIAFAVERLQPVRRRCAT